MFVYPRTWRDGETSIRFDSVNQGLANNLDTFRSMGLKRVGIATRSPEVVQIVRGASGLQTSETYFNGGYVREESIPRSIVSTSPSPTVYSTLNPPCVLWIPFKAINQYKKSTENIYIQVRVNASFSPINSYNWTYPISSSVIAYDYLGSEADTALGTVGGRSISWDQSLSFPTRTKPATTTETSLSTTVGGRIYLATQETLFDTANMTTTNVSLAAFQFRFVQYRTPYVDGTSGYPVTGTDTLSDFKIRVDLVIK